MCYTTFKGRFLSSNKIDQVNYYICEPESEIRAIIQFAHGWMDCFHRNQELIDYFTDHGILVCGCDFIGHNVNTGREFGDFKKKNAWTYLVQDLLKLNHYIRKTYADIPIYFYGHGLGSLVARMSLFQSEQCDGMILTGTSGKQHFCRKAELVSAFLKMFKGEDYHSALIVNMMEHKINARFRKEHDILSWECSDENNRYQNNMGEREGIFYSMGALRDMFYMLSKVSSCGWYHIVPKKMPILLLSGEDDPLGNFGKGIREVQSRLEEENCNVTMHLYKGMRHNIQDEKDKEKVFQDILSWIKTYLDE